MIMHGIAPAGRKVRSGYLPFRTNARTLPITPQQSSSRDVDPPEFLRRLALKVVSNIPDDAFFIHTDGSRNEPSRSGSGTYIKFQNYSSYTKLRNSDGCSVFRSELIAIDTGLKETISIPDPLHLFVETSIFTGHLLIPLQQHRKAILPCLPTSSSINVTLWKTDGEEEMVAMAGDIEFDPRFGFILYYPIIYFNGYFQCRAVSGEVNEAINLTLIYMPDTFNPPQPFINTSEAQHPVVNSTFILKCTVIVDPDTRLFISWDYPNKNNSQGRINETQPYSQWKTARSFKHQEVSTNLIVKNAVSSDSGHYVCTVTDHSQKTGLADVNIYVYENSAAWSDSQEFTAAFTSSLSLKCFPPRLRLRYRKR
ncbi:vascular endothelial growth factor receptor 2 [Trichonephila clavipes]|nr:vascular endothelial growth factor receptor 2 [Trichonephila clavipes]